MATPVSYARVARTFWTDPDIKRRLTPEQKELLLYYFTSPHGNMVGLYYLPLEYAASETGLDLEDIRSWTGDELAAFVSYDEETEEVLVHRAAVHQIGADLKEGDNRVKAVNRILVDAHSHRLVRRFLEIYSAWPLIDPLPRGRVQEEGPSKAPSQAPSKPDAVADAVSGTGTEPSSAVAPEHEDAASEIIRAANRGLHDNPAIPQYEPISTSHGSRQEVLDWLQEGIPTELVVRTVYEAAASYEPDPPRHRQVNSMRYFTGRLHDEWSRAKAEEAEVPAGVGLSKADRKLIKRRQELEGVDLSNSRSVFDGD